MASEYYALVKSKWDNGEWTDKMLRALVEEITGEKYEVGA